MLRENIEQRLKEICPAAESVDGSKCAFAPSGALGFIDTSSARNGSRGIAFFGDRMFVNTDGAVREAAYKSISGIQIISSFEDTFADELSVTGDKLELRISDYSLDKFELKRLLEELCRENEKLSERREEQAEKYAEMIAQKLAGKAEVSAPAPTKEQSEKHAEMTAQKLAGKAEENAPAPIKEQSEKKTEPDWLDDDATVEGDRPFIEETVIDIPETRTPLPEGYAPAPIPEEKIDWLSGASPRAASAEEPPRESVSEKPSPKPLQVMNGVVDRAPLFGALNSKKTETPPEEPAEKKEPPAEKPAAHEPTENEMREQLENMPREEIMKFLSDTLNEINSPFFEQTDEAKSDYGAVLQTVPPTSEETEPEPAPAAPEAPPSKWAKLTEEPIWGDIYIKASKNLRELCESGKLTMEQMEEELKERLLGAAEAFERITDNESKVPKMMIPKITELKAAAENFDQYFGYGEDIAVRAMFFMLYQMLTYADRIAETPETKDRLNDFFRRFGPAGITLSMLDMRV